MGKQIIHRSASDVKVELEVLIKKEDDYFVSYCPALNLSSYGKTPQEARENFETEIKIFIEETINRGTLEKYLLQQGWSLKKVPLPSYVPPMQPKVAVFNNQTSFMETVAIPL